MDASPTQSPGSLVVGMLFKLNGPARLGKVTILPTQRAMAVFLND